MKILIADDQLMYRRLARAALEPAGHEISEVDRILELRTALGARVIALEEALAQVQQLQGLLPMCAWCKKIRDEKNYWQQVEQYIAGHTKAQFTPQGVGAVTESAIQPSLPSGIRTRCQPVLLSSTSSRVPCRMVTMTLPMVPEASRRLAVGAFT